MGVAGVRRYEEPQSKILRGPEDTYGPLDEFQVRDGGRGTVSVGVKHPFGMFYAHTSKKRRQVFSFPGFPPTIGPISVGGKSQLSCFLPIEKAKLGGKQLNS